MDEKCQCHKLFFYFLIFRDVVAGAALIFGELGFKMDASALKSEFEQVVEGSPVFCSACSSCIFF